jgi:hypothetical protein
MLCASDAAAQCDDAERIESEGRRKAMLKKDAVRLSPRMNHGSLCVNSATIGRVVGESTVVVVVKGHACNKATNVGKYLRIGTTA